MRRLICSFIIGLQLSVAVADSAEQLPDPLSLQHVIQMANQADYFALVDAESNVLQAQSQLEQAESLLGFRAQLELEAAYIEPSDIAFDQSSNDSSATLRLTKPLYDFGRSNNSIQAANIEQAALQANMVYVIAQRKIEIAKSFFEVILSDLKYAWDNEAMATAYVRHSADKDRYALSQISDLELLESENRYLDALHRRSLSEMDQRNSRVTLAEVLNRPSELPSNLLAPELDFKNLNLPDYAMLLDNILKNNWQIKLAEQQQLAAQQKMLAEDQQLRPLLSAELAVSEYARTKSSDDMRATLNLTVPLYESSSIKSRVTHARANLLKKRSDILNLKAQVRKQAMGLWQSITVLKARNQQLEIVQDFRELQLDKSRALYEMEVKTDLGVSMIAISEIHYLRAKNKYELALAWMRLRLLAGETDVMNATL